MPAIRALGKWRQGVRHSRASFGLYIEFEARLKKKKEKEKQGGRKEARKKGKTR